MNLIESLIVEGVMGLLIVLNPAKIAWVCVVVFSRYDLMSY